MIDVARLREFHPEILEEIRQGMCFDPRCTISDDEISSLSWAEAMQYWLVFHDLEDSAERLLVALRTLRRVGDDNCIEEDQRSVGDWIDVYEEYGCG